MSTELFKLFMAAGNAEAVSAYLRGSSFDELIELDRNRRIFKSIVHTPKKYSLPLSEITYSELLGSVSEILLHPEDRKAFVDFLSPDTLARRLGESEFPGLICGQFRFSLLTNGWCWTELAVTAGKQFGLSEGLCRIYIFDINNQKARELGQRPVHSATADSHNEITGLLRRRAFTRMAERILRESTEKLCVISVDIENFKLFNEWYGHDKGDLLMVQIGAKLRDACKASGGIAGYFGQDDFCLLMPYDPTQIKRLYDVISELILSYGSATGFMPAFGVCITDDSIMIRDALDKAFIAVRYAKESYHSRIKLFDEGMYSRTQEEYHVLSDFFQAMKKNEVVFFLQPQCRASTG